MQPEEVRHRLLRMIEQQPGITQREAARQLGVSVGKVNYCLKALVTRGYVKLGNFHRNTDKRVYRYLLTPSGLEEKARVAVRFLQRKMDEYERLRTEIELLSAELGSAAANAPLQGKEVQ